jgi:outer membrane protein OmpA-like peptidoglycan-associated protein
MTTNALFDENEGVALRLVGIIVALLVALVIGFGVHKSRSMAKPAAAAPAAIVVEQEVAAILVEDGVVKFFFASASAELAGGANEALAQLTQALAGGEQTLVVSGYHDASGDAALNAELARQRALAVREALLALGVAEARIELSKPALATGSGSPRQARRVEVLLR